MTAPHERAIITVEYRSAEQTGNFESKWILSYRDQTFGPMLCCSIQIGQTQQERKTEAFEVIDVPLPACFDLTKPYQPEINQMSIYSRCSSSVSTRTDFSVNSSINNEENSTPLIDLTMTNEDIESKFVKKDKKKILHSSFSRSSSFVSNMVAAAKQAGSTAKAIFNTRQANDQVSTTDELFEHVENEPMNILFEMGFKNRAQNQRLLENHQNDLNKVIEILTVESFD